MAATPTRVSGAEVRLSMSRVIIGWAFGAIFFNLTSGAIYASFARQLGVSESVFGFLAGVFPLFSFIQLPAARLLETRWRPRPTMLVCGIIGRVLWVVAAAMPLVHKFAPAILPREFMLPAFVVSVVVSSFFQAFTGPAFFSWMSALVPSRVGPSFWARRHQIGTIMAIVATIIGGQIADQAGLIKEWSNDEFPPLLLYSVLLTVAAFCGVMDIVMFWNVQEPPEHAPQDDDRPRRTPITVARALRDRPLTENSERVWRGLRREVLAMAQSLQAPLRERAVRNYLCFIATAMVGFATTGPLLWLLCLERFEWPKTQTGFLLTVSPLVGMALTSRFWGDMARDHGLRPMARLASIGMVFIPIAWLLATPDSWFPMLIIIFLSGVLFSAYEMCNINFITRSCPHLPRPTLTAIFGITAGTTAALSSWFAGVFAEYMDGFSLEFLGREFVNYHLVFLISLVPRLATAFIIAPRLEEPEATPTREAMREVGLSLYQAFAARFSRLFTAR